MGRAPLYLAALRPAVLCLAATIALAPPATAADGDRQPHLVIELNNIQQQPAACRLSLLIENKLGAAIEDLGFELVLFATDERIMQLLAVQAGAFPKAKTRVKQFDLKSVDCAGIGRILLNNVTSCTITGFTPATCLAATRTRSRTTVQLTY